MRSCAFPQDPGRPERTLPRLPHRPLQGTADSAAPAIDPTGLHRFNSTAASNQSARPASTSPPTKHFNQSCSANATTPLPTTKPNEPNSSPNSSTRADPNNDQDLPLDSDYLHVAGSAAHPVVLQAATTERSRPSLDPHMVPPEACKCVWLQGRIVGAGKRESSALDPLAADTTRLSSGALHSSTMRRC